MNRLIVDGLHTKNKRKTREKTSKNSISQPPGRRGESKKMLKCKICGSPAKMVKTNLGYFVECEKNGHIHNAGIYPNTHICKTPEQAEKEWDKFNK